MYKPGRMDHNGREMPANISYSKGNYFVYKTHRGHKYPTMSFHTYAAALEYLNEIQAAIGVDDKFIRQPVETTQKRINNYFIGVNAV